MANFHWQGLGPGTRSDWNDGRNWVNDSGTAYVQATYPGSTSSQTDNALFDAALAVGAVSPGAYLGTDPGYVNISVASPYNGGIGEPSSPVEAHLSQVVIKGNPGNIYLKPYVAAKPDLVLQAACSVWPYAAWGNINVLQGIVNGVGLSADSLVVSYTSLQGSDASVIMDSLSTASALTMLGGKVVLNGGNYSAAPLIAGGTLVIQTTLDAGFIQTGGVVQWILGNLASGGGPYDGVLLYGGTLDGSMGSSARTFQSLHMYPGSTLNLDNGLANITPATSTDLVWYGGKLKFSSSANVAGLA